MTASAPHLALGIQRLTRCLLAGLIMAAAAACSHGSVSGASPAPGAAATGMVTVPTPAHVVILLMENKDNATVIGAPNASYLTSLAQHGAVFTDSHAITHPSQPNYLALFAGDTFGSTDDRCPTAVTGTNLAQLLTASGHSFAAYSEDLPTAGYLGCHSGGYARKHAPWADFPDLPATVGRPFTEFPTGYATLPTVAFVVPNLCHDMHDCDIATGDTWVHQHLADYLNWAQTHNSLLLITWDEADNSASNQIPTLFIGPMVRPGRYDERIDHYRVLRTLEDMYRLPHAGHSQTATPITDIWHRTT